MSPLVIGLICFYIVLFALFGVWGYCVNASVGGKVDAMFRSHLTPSNDHYTGIRKWAYDRAYNQYIANEPREERRREISAMRWAARVTSKESPKGRPDPSWREGRQ